MPSKIEDMLHNAEVPVEFADEREEQLVRIAVQGQDARDFLESSVGRFVVGSAVQDQKEIEERLATINPNTTWRRRKIEELQSEHAAITRAVSWLCEAVQLGLVAERELNQPEE